MLIICLIICLSVSLQAVVASEVDNQTVMLSDSNEDSLSEMIIQEETDTYNERNEISHSGNGNTDAMDYDAGVLKADNTEALKADVTVDGNSFEDIRSAIESSNDGDTIFLKGGSYIGTGTEIIVDKEITIVGGSSLTDNTLATLDANYQSRIFNVTANNVVIKNINFIKGVLSGDGAAIYWSGENGYLSNSNFNDNHATYSGNNYYSAKGGAVCWNGKYGILSNSTFSSNTAGYGGGIVWMASNGTVRNSNFTKNTVGRDGGSVYWIYEYGKLFECNFINNIASYEGGGIRWTGFAGNISYCNFTENLAGEFAGGAVSFNSMQGDILYCNFVNNTAGGYGGAIRTDGGYYEGTHSQTIGNCTFLFNKASSGGAIFSNTVNGTIRDSYFLNNSASGSAPYRWYEGGAILWDSWTGTLLNCTLINNTASRGGAISKDGADFRIINSTFINNSAKSNPNSNEYARGSGGAIFWLGAMGWIGGIYNSTVTNNTAENDGGAIYVSVTRVYFHNTTFTNNSAGRDGGAIYKDRPSSDTWKSTFINNTAGRNGGAIWITNENNTIRNSGFYNNSATENGGAIYITADGGILNSIYSSEFNNNSAFNGGAIYMRSTKSMVYNSSFIINSADYGGAVYWFSYGGKLDNSTFDNNSASYGGAVYWVGSEGNLMGSNFTLNKADLGGAVYWTYYLYPYNTPGKIDNSRFVNNTADLGGAVYWNDDDGTLSSSNYINNTATYGGAIYWIYKPGNSKSVKDGLYGAFNDGTYGLIDNSVFTHNKAHNGSAIYSEKDYLSIEKVHFDENQAWSYLLFVDANPKESIYNTEDINITVEYVACDNIINAIWNNVSHETIRLLNCSYTHSINGEIYTNPTEYEVPVLGAENSNEGSLLYQDNHEYLQIIDLNITDKKGNLWYSAKNLQTDIYGKVSIIIPKSQVKKGNNTVVGMHPEDWNYKFIRNDSWFLVTGPDFADLEVIKENDHVRITDGNEIIETCRKGDIVYWTITVINHGPDDAINAVLKDILPKGLKYLSDDSGGNYDKNTGIWKLGDITVGDNRTLIIKTEVLVSNTTILNLAVVSSDTPDPNETNNKDNSSVPVLPIIDLEIIKNVDKTNVLVGDKVTFTLTVINHGPDTAVNTRVSDVLPKGLKLISFKVSRGSFDSESGLWSIGDLKPGESVEMLIVAEALTTGNIINYASVTSDTPEDDLSNNNDSAAVDVSSIPRNHTVSPVEPDVPVPELYATGNPILMVLMAICVIIGTTLRRKN